MPKVIGAVSILIGLAACSDKVLPIKEVHLQRNSTARYVKILYGGAAGGVTYCVNLVRNSHLYDCVIAAVDIDSGDIEWDGKTLIFTYCGGEITNGASGVMFNTEENPVGIKITNRCIGNRVFKAP